MDSFLLDFDLVLTTLLFYLIDKSFEISHTLSFKASQKSSEVRLSSIMETVNQLVNSTFEKLWDAVNIYVSEYGEVLEPPRA